MTIRPLTFTALVVAAASLVLMAIRLGGVISFNEPLHVGTSGWEPESLLAIWSYLHDLPIYVSRWDIPYRWAIYNWLFYAGYGTIVGVFLDLFSLGEAWLPTIARLITLIIMGAGIYCIQASYRVLLEPLQRDEKHLGLAFAVLVAAGPLVGFWAMTTRPDLGAMVLEVLGVILFWRWFDKRPLIAVLLFCLAAYIAWSFKQSNVATIGAVGLFLLVRRRWTPLVLLIITMVSAWGATFVIGSSEYLTSITLAEYKWSASASHAFSVFYIFSKKTIPALVGVASVIAVIALSKPLRRSWWNNDPFVFSVAGVGVTLSLALMTVPQPGSSDGYLFTFCYFLSLVVMTGNRLVRVEGAEPRAVGWVNSAAWGLQLLALIAVLSGQAGILSVRFQHDNYTKLKACADSLPRPLFVPDLYMSLPWMTPGNPSFILAYGYRNIAGMGGPSKLERGGLDGLVREGYFASLVQSPSKINRYVKADLDGYKRIEKSCPPYDVYLRKDLLPSQ